MSALLISTHLYEKRPLKKPKLGPPDVYPQDPKQKEDELTAVNVKHGYNATVLQDEYGTARNANITPNRFGKFFSDILSTKHELNRFPDTSRKKQQINKDSTLYVTPKTKSYADAWFKDLASNTKSLSHLSRKVPVFNKKEDIFTTLYEFSVPMIKAEWFIKLSCAHQTAMSESNNKSKKRQMPDPSQEWTMCLTKFLKEHYLKLVESVTTLSSGLNLQPLSTEELIKQWNYYTQLARFLYEDYLLDRHDFLSWLLELFEKIKSIDDPMLNLVVPLLVQYIDEYTQSEFLSRRVAYYCAKKISQLVIEYNVELNLQSELEKENINSANASSEKSGSKSNESNNNLLSNIYNTANLSGIFKEIISCVKHRNIIYGLSTIIQVITLDCPTALVWLNYNSQSSDSNGNSSRHQTTLLQGSPLDYLPCEPSSLPMPPSDEKESVRNRIKNSENLIRHRSTMSEKKWFFKVFEQVHDSRFVGNIVNRLLNVLDHLDKHIFDKVSTSNSIDSLYVKIFNSPLVQIEQSASHSANSETDKKTIAQIVEDDVPLVKLLCEWAVTSKRIGEYRGRVVAKLLEKRQNSIWREKEKAEQNETTKMADAEDNLADSKTKTAESKPNNECHIPIYQNVLFEFLDLYAPVYEDKRLNLFPNSFNNSSLESKQMFNSLIILFSELIRQEVFSHDAYMCTLISRGLFTNHPNTAIVNFTNLNHSTKNNPDDSLTGLVPTLAGHLDSVSNGGLIGTTLHKSTSSSSLPMFDCQLPLSNNSTMNSNEPSNSNWLDEDLDEDLDKILQNIKRQQGQQSDQNDILLPDAIESDKEDEAHGPISSSVNNAGPSSVNKNVNHCEPISSTSRHLLYTLHFPLPQDEFFVHECNQRHILLYGVGKTKDDAKHSVKKVTKEIQKLFNRKSSYDIGDGGKVKKNVFKEGFNVESALARFQNLSIFDQHVLTNSCASNVLEMLNGVVNGNANHLPHIDSIVFLFDLMEVALNIYGLVEFITQMLKELVGVESQLQQKCSMLARPYCTSIALYIVGVLNRYHNYVVVSNEDIVAIFDGLLKLIGSTPADCSSAERCIFFYIHDLYSSCSYVLKKYHDEMSSINSKIKQMSSIQTDSTPITMNSTYNMMEYLKNPKILKVDPAHIPQLKESASNRYSLVFSAICCICEATDMDYLNELSVLCAELTALCSLMSNEWCMAFKALCDQIKTKNNYTSLLTKINFSDRAIYDNLAIFVSILVARRCFSLEDFILNICLKSLLIPTIDLSDEAERSARLSCHLTLYLFKYYDFPQSASNSMNSSSFASSSRYSLTSPGPLCLSSVAPPMSGQKPQLKYACDRYLLGGVLNSLQFEHIVLVLKAIFALETQIEKRVGEKGFGKSEKSEMNYDSILKPISSDDDFNEISLLGQITSKPKIDSIDKTSVFDFAKHVLRQICMQDWIHDRCLRGFLASPNKLRGLLLDKRFSHKDSQHLLNIICYHKQILPSSAHINDKSDSKQLMRLFQILDEWSIRISWLQLTLIYEQLAPSSQSQSVAEVNTWLETLARAVVDYYQQSSQTEPILDYRNLSLFTSKSSVVRTSSLNFPNTIANQNERIWLIAPLISKLPSSLQSKIMRATSNIFDTSSWILYSQSTSGSLSSKSKGGFQGAKNSLSGIVLNNQNYTSILLLYHPFISLLLLCLNSKEDYKDSVLNSIYLQISQCINEKLSDEIKMKNAVQEGLQLRFSLVGAMFGIIQSSSSSTNDWSILLLQLISYTIVDPHINYENFTTVLDMLTCLMHSTQISYCSPEQREESKKQNQNLIKKMKKELNIERVGLGVMMAKQLLPLVKLQTEVITCVPMGSLVDTKGNKIPGFDSIDKKQGLQVAEKQKLAPWELIEGHKNPAPLSWTWFGGIKMERKPLRLEENFYLLARHNHNIRESTGYYIEAPPLPEEESPPPPPPPPQPVQMLPQGMPPFPPYGNNMMGPGGPPPPGPHGPPPPHLVPPVQGPPQQFNSPNMMHPGMQQQQQHQPGPLHQPPPGNYPPAHMHPHMHPIPNNGLPPHGMSQVPPPGIMHNPNMMPQQQHMMGGSSGEPPHPMSQPPPPHQQPPPPPHHLILNTGPQMGPGPMSMRPPMPTGPPMPMHAGIPPPVATRGPAPKKPKAPRRKRALKNQPVNGVPQSGQQTPPIRMGFDGYNQAANSQMSQGGGNNTWAGYQQPNQQGPQSQASQSFYQQNGPPTSATQQQQQQQPPLMGPQSQPARFADHSMQNNSKFRLRAMLNTRMPNATQFNMGPSGGPGNSGNQMMGNQNSGNMLPGGVYTPRQMQMMQGRQMRPQANVSQQQPMNQASSGQMHHHMQQSYNFPGSQNIPFNNNSSSNNMQNMDSSMQQMAGNAAGGGGGGYQTGQAPQQQPTMMQMRPQMQMGQQQQQQIAPTSQAQFMQQRSQYSNQQQQQSNYGQQPQQQQQSMLGSGQQPQPGPQQQHWPQQNQMGGGTPRGGGY